MKAKETIYIDVDDEITAVIHKVISSDAKLVVLVLPKRAPVFQSTVNLKLLKSRVTKERKNLVLVSSDTNLRSLAGVVGLSVAKDLKDKPVIPAPPETKVAKAEDSKDETVDVDNSKSLGEVAAMSSVGVSHVASDEALDSIEIDNDQLETKDKKDDSKKPKKEKIDKKLRVPDFGKFQKVLIIGFLSIVAIIVLYIVGFVYLPKAKITIQTNTSTLDSTIPIKFDTNAVVLNTSSGDVPANMQSLQKTVTSNSVNTTGTKLIGIAASGSVTVYNPKTNGIQDSVTIPVGTQFTDPNGNIYVSTTSEFLDGTSTEDPPYGGKTQVTIPVSAISVGKAYNNTSNNVNFTSNDSVIQGLSIIGGPFSGGTSQTVQVVAQADINTATSQIVAPVKTSVEATLEQQITAAGYTPLTQTFVATPVTYAPSDPAGTQTNTVTVAGTYSYSMYGVHNSDLNTLIDDYIDGLSTFNSNHQSILDTGLTNATFSIQSSTSTTLQGNLSLASTIGPKLSVSAIKAESAGKSSSYIIDNISSMPGVTSVTIKYSPFWVRAMTHSQSKITVVIEKSNGSAV